MPRARGSSLRLLAAALVALLLLLPAAPGRAQGLGEAADYAASLDSSRLSGIVGQEVELAMTLTPPVPPAGYFVTTLVTPLEVPEGPGPGILPGFPVTVVVPRAPGRHRFSVRVHLVTKSSCGGVDARTVLDTTLTLDATPAGP